jgi:hypothetical protein
VANGIGGYRVSWVIRSAALAITAGAAMVACGGAAPTASARSERSTVAAPLAAADRTHAARAAAYAAEVARYQQLAAQARAMSAVYASWTPDATDSVKTNYNAKLKAQNDALAAGEDKRAADAQKAVDFHTAAAANELAQ